MLSLIEIRVGIGILYMLAVLLKSSKKTDLLGQILNPVLLFFEPEKEDAGDRDRGEYYG